jgi:UDP:flavonoid glycosyltransferase YjiC (YdhE family)
MLTRYLYLLLIPPSFQFPDFPLPPVTHTLRPVFPLGSALADALPAWFSSMPDQPTVYVSMGTVFNRAPEVFQIVLDGLKDEALNLVLTVGRNRDPAQFGPMPENVHIEQFIPQAALIPHCDLVITHGGINTVMGALQEGLPVLTVPLSAHQLENTLRCRQLGVGIDLRPPWWQAMEEAGAEGRAITALSQVRTNVAATGLFADEIAELAPANVRQAVHALLEKPAYRQAAQAIQVEIAAQPGPEHAVTLLERLAEEKAPIPA